MTGSLIQILGWTLLHSFWQLGAAWLFNWLLQAVFVRASPHVRYVIACAMLFAGAASTVVTSAVLQAGGSALIISQATIGGLVQLIHLSHPSALMAKTMAVVQPVVPWLVAIWLVATCYRLAGVVYEWCKTTSFRNRSALIDERSLPACWSTLKAAIVPRGAVEVAYGGSRSPSSLPAVLGWVKPIVLVPAGFFAELSPETIEAILAHELAHIRRRDYAVNLLQVILEAVFWFHPCVRLLSDEIVFLREQCCDDLAVRAIGEKPKTYSRAILDLYDSRQASLAMSATGSSDVFKRLSVLLVDRDTRARRLAGRVGVVCVGAALALGMVSRTVAAKVSYRAEITRSFAKPLPDTVYDLLGARARNPQFVAAVCDAVDLFADGQFTGDAAISFAAVVNMGADPSALLQAALPSISARSLHPSLALLWAGGGGSDWDNLSRSLYAYATNEKEPQHRMALARASLLLASQARVNAGSYLNRLLREPNLGEVARLNQAQVNQLIIAASAESAGMAAAGSSVTHWMQSEPWSIPADISNATSADIRLQWVIANYIWRTTQDDSARADSLISSARATGILDNCLGFLERDPHLY